MGSGYNVTCRECPTQVELFLGVGMLGQTIAFYCPHCGELDEVFIPRSKNFALYDPDSSDLSPPKCSKHADTSMVYLDVENEGKSFFDIDDGNEQSKLRCSSCGAPARLEYNGMMVD